MKTRGLFAFAALSMVSMGFAAPMAAQPAVLEGELPTAGRQQKKRRHSPSPTVVGRYKSKNPPTKRKLRANRLHISRRARRKHRRARKAA